MLPEHPAADGWTLKYELSREAGAVAFTITAGTDTDGAYLVDVPAANTDLEPGTYRWVERVEKGPDRHTVGGTARGGAPIHVKSVTHESTAARMVRIISAAIEDIVSGRKQQVSINSRGHTLLSLEDLRRELNHWQAVLEQERRPGLTRPVAVRFQAPGFVTGDLPVRGYL